MIDNRIAETCKFLNGKWTIHNAFNGPMLHRMSNYEKMSILRGGLVEPCPENMETSLDTIHFKIMTSILSSFSGEGNVSDTMSPDDFIYMAKVCN